MPFCRTPSPAMFSNAEGDTFQHTGEVPLVRTGQGDATRDWTPQAKPKRKPFEIPTAPAGEVFLAVVFMLIGAACGAMAMAIFLLLSGHVVR